MMFQVVIATIAIAISIFLVLKIPKLLNKKSNLEKEINLLEEKKAEIQKSLDKSIDILNEKSKNSEEIHGSNRKNFIDN